MEDYRDRQRDQIDARRQERERTRREVFGADAAELPPIPEPLPDLRSLPLEQAIAAYDDWAGRAVAARRRAFIEARVPAPVEPPVPSTSPPAPQPPAGELARVDALVARLFDLPRVFPDRPAARQVQLCTSAADFVRPLEAIGLSAREQRTLLQGAEGSRPKGPVLSRLAYTLPGRACFVNGPLLARRAGVADPLQALEEPEHLFSAVRAIAAATYGWGFLLAYTQEGEERRRLDLWQEELAEALGLAGRPERPPAAAAAVAAEYRALAAAGWNAWIVETVEQAARRQRLGNLPRSQFSLKSFWQVLRRVSREAVLQFPLVEIADGVLETVQEVVADDEAGLALIHRQVNAARRWTETLDAPFQRLTGWSCAAWLSRLLLDKVEDRVGSFCLPYAVTIAFHVEHQLDRQSAAALRAQLESAPRQGVDTRLRLLAGLEQFVKYDISTMAAGAWERLQLNSPPELRRA